jgi:histidine phosphotransferase ChpT
MSPLLDRRVLELLIARLCHDLAGPVAAVGNGAEMLADDDPGFAEEALRLVADSADAAASRLAFYRFAFGVGDDGAVAASPSDLAARFFAATAIACDYAPSARLLPPTWQQLACNLLLVGADGLPRGGTLTLCADAGGGLILEAVGEQAALAPELAAALSLALPVTALSPRTVTAFLAAVFAGALGSRLIAGGVAAGRFRVGAAAAGRQPGAPSG